MHPHPHQVCFCNCLSCACYLLVFQRPSVSDSHQRFIQPPSNCFLWFSPLHTLKAHLSYHPQSCFIICSSVYRNSSTLPCYTNLTSSPAFPVLLSSSPSFFCNITAPNSHCKSSQDSGWPLSDPRPVPGASVSFQGFFQKHFSQSSVLFVFPLGKVH